MHRPVHGWRVYAVVDHSLSDVGQCDTLFQESLGYRDELMRAVVSLARVEVWHVVDITESRGEVVGTQNGGLGNPSQANRTARRNVGPASHENSELPDETADLADGLLSIAIEIETAVIGHHDLRDR